MALAARSSRGGASYVPSYVPYVSHKLRLRVPLRVLYVSHTSPHSVCPVVLRMSRTCPVRVPYVSNTSRKPARVADALEEQEESDSEGPAVKKYRTMLTTDRGAFDKEAVGFLRNLWGQGKSEGGGVA